MNKDIFGKMMEIAERFFDTANDPDQISITQDSADKLLELHPKTIAYKAEGEDPISWIVVVPTSKELAWKFIDGEITEQELLDRTEPKSIYEAIYLCSAFTVPEQRNKGYAVELFKESLAAIPRTQDALLFAWPYSEEGRSLLVKLEKEFGIKIELKK